MSNAAIGGRRAGFTLVEMLVVIAMIMILLSLLIVGLNLAARASQKANTQALMTSLRQGLIRFKEDVGYYPPVLDRERDLFYPPVPGSGDYRNDIQDWYSVTTLAEYMVGYGHHQQDGFGFNPDEQAIRDWSDESPPTGIRDPLFDGVWGASRFNGALSERMRDSEGNYGSETAPHPFDLGQVFGPYIELSDDRTLGGLLEEDGAYRVVFAGEIDPAEFEPLPKVIVDYWGEPIRYYRLNYPRGAIRERYRALNYDGDASGRPDPVPTLSDVFVLRPFEIQPENATDSRFSDDSPSTLPLGDRTTSFALQSGEFALLSSGPDQQLNEAARADFGLGPVDGLNRDNIVEVGP